MQNPINGAAAGLGKGHRLPAAGQKALPQLVVTILLQPQGGPHKAVTPTRKKQQDIAFSIRHEKELKTTTHHSRPCGIPLARAARNLNSGKRAHRPIKRYSLSSPKRGENSSTDRGPSANASRGFRGSASDPQPHLHDQRPMDAADFAVRHARNPGNRTQ